MKTKMKRKTPFVLFLLSAALIIIGLRSGEFAAVLEKAVTVCLSCIGIG
jgi:hypothetical protein